MQIHHVLLTAALAILPLASTSDADPIDQTPRMMTLNSGIVCETPEAIRAAFDWASNNPHAEYVDLSENPQCTFISARTLALVQPLEIYETDVATVLIGSATPPNGDTRYIWMQIRMRAPSIEQNA